MRRPPPLPNQPEEAQSAPVRPSWSADDGFRAPIEHDARVSPLEVGATPADAEPETLDALTAKDVWRATRARRKRLRAEIRRFTQRSRRRRMIWAGVLGALVVLIGGSVAAAYSPLFAVEKITVVGASALDAAEVEAALAGQIGTPLALVDDRDVKAALMAFPLIESFSLEGKPPHDLTLRIVERTPIGVIQSDAGYTLVDAAGVALSTTPQRPEGQPVLAVTGGTGSDVFESVGLVVRSLPADVRPDVVEVTATTLDDVTLTLASGLTIIWGSADESVEKSKTLASVLTVRPDAQTVDISSYLTPVVG